jgi:chemotaxis protein MotB
MIKHKGEESEKEGNNDRWLLTYSDMITLLLALFIILYSMSTIDAKKMAKVAEQFSNALGTGTTVTAGKTSVSKAGTTGTGKAAGGASSGASGAVAQQDALDEVYSTLSAYVDKNGLQNSIGLDNTDNYVRIHLKDVLMFVPDSANMLPASQPALKEIEGAITQVYDRVDHITISGNTADVGEHTTASDQVSWRLSTDRAVTVLNAMVGFGLQEDKLSIEGYAHFNPIASNNNEIGRAQNRRVEITIYKYPAALNKSAGSTTSSASSSSATNGSVSSSATSNTVSSSATSNTVSSGATSNTVSNTVSSTTNSSVTSK